QHKRTVDCDKAIDDPTRNHDPFILADFARLIIRSKKSCAALKYNKAVILVWVLVQTRLTIAFATGIDDDPHAIRGTHQGTVGPAIWDGHVHLEECWLRECVQTARDEPSSRAAFIEYYRIRIDGCGFIHGDPPTVSHISHNRR